MNNITSLFRKVFICPNDVLSVTAQKEWLLNYCNVCKFHQVSSSICLLGVQQKTVSTRWQQGKVDILFFSFIFLSKLFEPQFLYVFAITTIQITSVFFKALNVSSSIVTGFPNIDSAATNFDFAQTVLQ